MPSHNGGAGGAGAPEHGAEVHGVAAEGLTDVFPPLQFPDQTPIWDGVVPDGYVAPEPADCQTTYCTQD